MNLSLAAMASLHLEDALLSLDRTAVRDVLHRTDRDLELTPTEVADLVISPALSRIGDGWERGLVALSEVYMSAKIAEECISIWGRLPSPSPGGPRIAIGVLEDYHALGKRVVHAVLSSAGQDVVDLGAGLSQTAMVEQALAAEADILMISVLMLNKALHVSGVVEALKAHGPERPWVVVGGAPFVLDPELWRKVGADACGRSAGEALQIARTFRREAA